MSNQPGHPDTFNYDEQDPAGDQDASTYDAPDEPMGAHAYGTTAAEQVGGETLRQRQKHTNPEVFEIDAAAEQNGVGQLLQPGDEDVDLADLESNTIALDEGAADYEQLSAEEAAMHTVEEP